MNSFNHKVACKVVCLLDFFVEIVEIGLEIDVEYNELSIEIIDKLCKLLSILYETCMEFIGHLQFMPNSNEWKLDLPPQLTNHLE